MYDMMVKKLIEMSEEMNEEQRAEFIAAVKELLLLPEAALFALQSRR